MTDGSGKRGSRALPLMVAAAGVAVVGLLTFLALPMLWGPVELDVDWVDETRRVARSADSWPLEQPAAPYVASDACRQCHQGNYASWHASYHRRMTQQASPDTVVGDFNDRRVELEGRQFHLQRRGDEFWVEMVDPDSHLNSTVTAEFPIVMTTGSHHMQIYWYPIGKGRTLGQLPIVWLIPEQRWTLRKSVFLEPPHTAGSETGRWNTTCVLCHTTAGQSRPLDEQFGGQAGFDSRAAEFGISCESCHGPGQGHIAYHRDAADKPDSDPIVNPRKLPHDLSSQVCGQCHAVTVSRDRQAMEREMEHGQTFRPGMRLTDHRQVVRDDPATIQGLQKLYSLDEIREQFQRLMWPDGMVRVSGREYNGLLESACHSLGELSCVDCHQLHQNQEDPRATSQWADDQLRLEATTDQGCVQCHESARYAVESHTHHHPASSGSRCYNCHMPHTTYGLVKAIRSHEIDSPDVQVTLDTGRPDACNLCHLDKSLSWTSQRLSEWYGTAPAAVEEDDLSAAAMWTLSGDAGQRALLAWHMGWTPAVEASGQDWLVPYLAVLLDDPYDAVRLIAHRSLRKHPAYGDFDYDYVGPAEPRRAAVERAMRRWEQQKLGANAPPGTLIEAEGAIDQSRFDELLRQRSRRPVFLAE